MERERVKEIENARQESMQDKGGIIVSHKQGIDFGVVDIAEVRSTPSFKITIQNTNPEGHIGLSEFRMASTIGKDPNETR